MEASNDFEEWARRSVAALLRRVALALLQEAVGMTAAAERLRGL